MGNSGGQLYQDYLDYIEQYKINVDPPLSRSFFLEQNRFLSNPQDKKLISDHQTTYSYVMKDVGEGKKVKFVSFEFASYATLREEDQKRREDFVDFVYDHFHLPIYKTDPVEDIEDLIESYKKDVFDEFFSFIESRLKDDFERMNELILDSSPLDQEYTVYRGLEFTERGRKASTLTKAFSKVKVGETMRVETYFSVSLDREVSEDYSGEHCCLLIIRLRKGSHCLFFFTSPYQRQGSIYLLEGLVEPCTLRLEEVRGEKRLEYYFKQI
jgi:hypothetical protein